MESQTTEPNEWKETVRSIFDALILARGTASPLEQRLRELMREAEDEIEWLRAERDNLQALLDWIKGKTHG